jgi:hypothetical protein
VPRSKPLNQPHKYLARLAHLVALETTRETADPMADSSQDRLLVVI